MRKPKTKTAKHFGYSLIELLVVMAVITVLLGIAFGVGNNKGSNFEVFTTSRSCVALFEDVRESAVKFSTTIKILVHNDAADADNYGRVIQVVREVPGEPDEGSTWDAYENPFLLPEGIFYSPEHSSSDNAVSPETFEFDGVEWLAYTVSQRGYFENYGALFVVVPGVRNSPEIIEKGNQRGGFMIQKRGRPVELDVSQLLKDDA